MAKKQKANQGRRRKSSAKDVLAGRNILLGVTGGIAAYKAAVLASMLVRRGAQVRTIMTEPATRFVGPITFQALTRQPVYLDMWAATESYRSDHIGMADWTDACVIAPATADVIGRIAAGLADDLLTTTVLALQAPVLLAPAMNTRMWAKPAVQDNVAKIEAWGYHLVGPAEGRLACGDTGPGRMSEPEEIIEALEGMLAGVGPRKRT